MKDYYFVYEFYDSVEYSSEKHKHKYNWKLSSGGATTGNKTVRLSTWQLQLSIL